MACGCNKKGARKTGPVVKPGAVRQGGNTPGVTGAQLKATQNPANPVNTAGLNAERRKIQALRRDAISRAFNK